MNEHEKQFVASFVVSKRRERFFAFFSSPKKRAKLIGRLAHTLLNDLDERYVYVEDKLPKSEADRIRRLAQSVNGTGRECYVLAEQQELDGKELSFDQAQSDWDKLSAIIISVIPGKLAFYRPERPSDNYVLLRG